MPDLPCLASRVFRRRRRPPAVLARLLGGVTDSCQSWLDDNIFRGVFQAEEEQERRRTRPESVHLNASACSDLDQAEMHKGHGFTYGQ